MTSMSSSSDKARRLTPALLVGVLLGAVVFAAVMGAGLLLYERLYAESATALIVILVLFGGAGAYAAWLVGVIVYSRTLDPTSTEE